MIKPLTHLGEVFREDFHSPFSVVKNGGSINGNPNIKNGYEGDGTGDSISTDVQWSSIGRAFTIFVKVDQMDSFSTKAIFGTSTGANGPMLRFASSTSVLFWNNTGATAKTFGIAAPTAPFTLAITYDDSTRGVAFYVDGVLDEAATMAQVGLFQQRLEIGGRLEGNNDSFDGKMGQFRVFNKVLSADEITDLHNMVTASEVNNPGEVFPLHDKIGSAAPFTTTGVVRGTEATLGDGSTSTTFPTKLTGKNGYSFDGGDYIDLGASVLNTVSATEVTVAAWINYDAVANSGVFTVIADSAAASTSVNEGFSFYIDDRGGSAIDSLVMSVHTTSGGARGELSTTNAIQQGLNFVVGTYDSTNFAKVFVNGVNVDSSDQGTATGDFVPDSTGNIFVGARVGPGNYFTGDILGFAMWDKALTPHQIKWLYSKGPRYLGKR